MRSRNDQMTAADLRGGGRPRGGPGPQDQGAHYEEEEGGPGRMAQASPMPPEAAQGGAQAPPELEAVVRAAAQSGFDVQGALQGGANQQVLQQLFQAAAASDFGATDQGINAIVNAARQLGVPSPYRRGDGPDYAGGNRR